MEKQLKIVRGELHRARDPTHLSITTLPCSPLLSLLGTSIPKQYLSMEPSTSTIGLTNPSSLLKPINSKKYPYCTPHPNIVTSTHNMEQINNATF